MLAVEARSSFHPPSPNFTGGKSEKFGIEFQPVAFEALSFRNGKNI